MKGVIKIKDTYFILDKRIRNKIKKRNKIICAVASIYIVLYQFILVRWEAAYVDMYYLGILLNTIAVSVVTSYIFYWITVALPYNDKIKGMDPIVQDLRKNLSDEIKNLIRLLTQVDNWDKRNNEQIKSEMSQKCEKRRIWNEVLIIMYETDDKEILYKPSTLTVIMYTLNRIENISQELYIYNEFINDTDYLQNIRWLRNSTLYIKIKKITSTVDKISSEKIEKIAYSGQTWVDSFFIKELKLRLFYKNEDDNYIIFMEKIRELIVD